MKMNLRFQTAAAACALLLAAAPGHAAETYFTSSSDFAAAAPGQLLNEDYSSGYDGQAISNGGTFNGITYTFTPGSSATLQGGLITSYFGGFNGFMLGANQGNSLPEVDPFDGTDSVTLTFPYWVLAAGVFVDAGEETGDYTLALGANPPYSLDSTEVSPDYTDPNSEATYFFLGVVSDTPFTTITISSTDPDNGAYLIAGVESVPEPATMSVLASGLIGLAAIARRRRRRR